MESKWSPESPLQIRYVSYVQNPSRNEDIVVPLTSRPWRVDQPIHQSSSPNSPPHPARPLWLCDECRWKCLWDFDRPFLILKITISGFGRKTRDSDVWLNWNFAQVKGAVYRIKTRKREISNCLSFINYLYCTDRIYLIKSTSLKLMNFSIFRNSKYPKVTKWLISRNPRVKHLVS